jgi:hypothetical protein
MASAITPDMVKKTEILLLKRILELRGEKFSESIEKVFDLQNAIADLLEGTPDCEEKREFIKEIRELFERNNLAMLNYEEVLDLTFQETVPYIACLVAHYETFNPKWQETKKSASYKVANLIGCTYFIDTAEIVIRYFYDLSKK